MIVEDDPAVARMLEEAVERYFGHLPVIEADSMRAAERIREPWDIILSDFLMPKMNGIELLTAFMDSGSPARRVLITAAPNEQEVRQAEKDGVVQLVLTKPTTLSELRLAFMWGF